MVMAPVLAEGLGLGAWAALGGGALLVVWGIGLYNGLVRRRVDCDNGLAQIEVQLKRRHDLVPNLVETVKGYAGHERETLERVAAARRAAVGLREGGAGAGGVGVAQLAAAEAALGGALRGVLGLQEGYPDLKASRVFLQLQEELVSTENKVGYARQFYNDAVRAYNTALQSFPGNLIAGALTFKAREFFELESPSERQAPTVKLN
jgi:LemA protein